MKTFLISLKIFLLLTILTGIIYPLLITGIAQLLFSQKANGSLIVKDNQIVGSELIGQKFDSAAYFYSRPSATDYQTLASGGSNLCISGEKLKKLVYKRKENFISANNLSNTTLIPSEMLFASASGLDPHISPEAAMMQVDRICKYRNYNESMKKIIVSEINRQKNADSFGFLGNEKVNVLMLNIYLDDIK